MATSPTSSSEDELKAIAADFKRSEAGAHATTSPADSVGLKLKRATEIADREQRWLVPDFLPDDSLIVVAGQVGLGKTTACMDWAASITNGRVPIISGKREARNALMLPNEDSEAQLRRIFVRLGGNLSRLYVEDEDSDLPWGLGDLPALEARILERRPALVIIDSLATHKPSKVDLNSHGDVAPMLVCDHLRDLVEIERCLQDLRDDLWKLCWSPDIEAELHKFRAGRQFGGAVDCWVDEEACGSEPGLLL